MTLPFGIKETTFDRFRKDVTESMIERMKLKEHGNRYRHRKRHFYRMVGQDAVYKQGFSASQSTKHPPGKLWTCRADAYRTSTPNPAGALKPNYISAIDHRQTIELNPVHRFEYGKHTVRSKQTTERV